MVDTNEHEHLFRTSDTSLAAYLKYQEITLHDIIFEDGRGVFVFSIPLPGMVDRFRNGEAMVLCRPWFMVYKDLLRELHEAERGHQRKVGSGVTSGR